MCRFEVTSGDCSGHFQPGANFTLGAFCGGLVTPDDGGMAVGPWQDLGNGRALFWIPAPRMLIGCPDCTLVEVGCE